MLKNKLKSKYVIGIDEVGRGALAGPVAVTALASPRVSNIKNKVSGILLKDSKKLSSKNREIWFEHIKENQKFFYTTALISPKVIDRINISQAANLAAARALKKLITNYQLPITKIKIYLDGGLYIKNQMLNTRYLILNTKTVIKGDEKINVIKLASIIAKVSRDRLMKKISWKYPMYGLEKHKGYGTKQHILNIKRCGPSRIHRLTFLKKIRYYRNRTTRMNTRSFHH